MKERMKQMSQRYDEAMREDGDVCTTEAIKDDGELDCEEAVRVQKIGKCGPSGQVPLWQRLSNSSVSTELLLQAHLYLVQQWLQNVHTIKD
ncbi:hypothetical protein QQP08_017859 [Theobroma cacao]|nr:hypothetical protein QQP08_017859 [Theobroma cacao]